MASKRAGLRRWIRRAAAALGLIGVAALASPEIYSRMLRAEARECLAKMRAPRGRTLPDCSPVVHAFRFPSRVSYTRHDATYRAEELYARIAIERYVDAAVGDPDPARLARTAAHVRRAQEVVETGSQRISLEDLGPSVGSPHLGKLAASLGDRTTLLGEPEVSGLWTVRAYVLEAALLEADFDLLDDVAHRFATWDPRDADLRTAVGAALCISDPSAGVDLLERVPTDRADKRYANIQRNFGEVLAVLQACSAKLGLSPPSGPTASGAGVADVPDVRLVTALRITPPGDRRDELVARALERLQADTTDGVDPGVPYARASLLAAVLAVGSETARDPSSKTPSLLDPAVIANLATPRERHGEGPLAPAGLTLGSILAEPPGLLPTVPARWLVSGAEALRAMAKDPKAAASRDRLLAASAALGTLAAAELARAGHAADAVTQAERAAADAGLSARVRALSVASAAYVAGDPERALSAIAGAPPPPGEAADPGVALAGLEALASASAGDLDRAKRIAATLPALAAAASDADTALEARWIAVAFGQGEAGPPPELPWTGVADPLGRWRERGGDRVREALSGWSRALAASPQDRRAFRYRLLERRGDMPALPLAYLVAAGRLLDDDVSAAGVELWLDALTAIDARRLRIRSYVWARAEAARIRGDEIHAYAWRTRLQTLRAAASFEPDLEITRFLRL